ncbi:hypothetical protein GLYMA_11G189300v4 [Glycine max]|uniref:Uncharacterized protein n=1 Tax=Glycine max TaxID=3847 RepID=A0A0R0HSG4_SOYBN|nr:hypothetical protein GYH30_031156 [Glycine max]KRH30515.1 hypothetical protein GLYMA_11G189300v4 [Glycine max]
MHDQCVSLTHNHLLSPPKTRLKASSKSYWKYLRRDIEEDKRVGETNKQGVWLRKCICFSLRIFTCNLFDAREQCMLSASNFTQGKTQGRKGFLFFSSWNLIGYCVRTLTNTRYDPPPPPPICSNFWFEQCELQFRELNSMVCTCHVM